MQRVVAGEPAAANAVGSRRGRHAVAAPARRQRSARAARADGGVSRTSFVQALVHAREHVAFCSFYAVLTRAFLVAPGRGATAGARAGTPSLWLGLSARRARLWRRRVRARLVWGAHRGARAGRPGLGACRYERRACRTMAALK